MEEKLTGILLYYFRFTYILRRYLINIKKRDGILIIFKTRKIIIK